MVSRKCTDRPEGCLDRPHRSPSQPDGRCYQHRVAGHEYYVISLDEIVRADGDAVSRPRSEPGHRCSITAECHGFVPFPWIEPTSPIFRREHVGE